MIRVLYLWEYIDKKIIWGMLHKHMNYSIMYNLWQNKNSLNIQVDRYRWIDYYMATRDEYLGANTSFLKSVVGENAHDIPLDENSRMQNCCNMISLVFFLQLLKMPCLLCKRKTLKQLEGDIWMLIPNSIRLISLNEVNSFVINYN